MFEHRFTIDITEQPDVIHRILTTCRRRNCQVVALAFVAGDRHRRGQLTLTLRASHWHGDRIASWLAGLIDVLHIQESDAAATAGAPGLDSGIAGGRYAIRLAKVADQNELGDTLASVTTIVCTGEPGASLP